MNFNFILKYLDLEYLNNEVENWCKKQTKGDD